MERFLLPDPLPASGNLPEQWLHFKKQFAQFLDASDKSDANAKTKTAILLRCIGDKGNGFAHFSSRPGFTVVSTLGGEISTF